MSFVFGRPLKEGNLMREDKEVKDQKHRNAYKREWRNRRNANRIANEIMELKKALRRSNTLAWQAWDENRKLVHDR